MEVDALTFEFWSLLAASYLVGAIPFGLLIGWSRGQDVRRQGSGNIGATNVGRVLGKPWGYLCLGLDIVKGLAPAVAAGLLVVGETVDAGGLLRWLMVGAAAVIGHTFPVYLGFRGGKGVATTIGVGLGVWPWLTAGMAGALAAYAIGRFATGIVSVGSLAMAAAFPLVTWAYAWYRGLPLGTSWPLLAVSGGLAALIVVRHRSNIARLLRGEEKAVRRETSA
jgi:glycerol-3-phosphate acyltransferase PlsY